MGSRLFSPSPLIKLDGSISNIQLSDWIHRNTHGSDPHNLMTSDGTEDAPFALRHSWVERSSVLRDVVDSSSITALFPLSPAHQKQGPFPPPALPGLNGLTALSDFRAGHHP